MLTMRSAVVVIPTTGLELMKQAVESVLGQTHADTTCMVVIDGRQFEDRARQLLAGIADSRLQVLTLASNSGGGGYCGHRIYAAFSHLVEEEYVLYLDEDNWLDPAHVQSLVESIERGKLQWAYCLRKIFDRSGRHLFNDDCQSLGRWPSWTGPDQWLVDTSCYCIRRDVAVQIAAAWHNKFGADRVVLRTLQQRFPAYDTTGLYTLNYRLGSRQASVPQEFLEHGNRVMRQLYPGGFPWSK